MGDELHMDDDACRSAFDRLAGCTTPLLIGVRHHSAALARVMPALLDDLAPKSVLVEMPPDFQSWLEYVGDESLRAPVALAACHRSKLLSFYPLADFSPELAAIRWASKNDVPVIPCDLDLTSMSQLDAHPQIEISNESKDAKDANDASSTRLGRGELTSQLMRRVGARDTGELWEKLVETAAVGADPESIRRAGLLFGWAMRYDSGSPTFSDAHRELAMRNAIASAPDHSVAVVGAFHAAALLPEPLLWSQPADLESSQTAGEDEAPTTSLIPYSFPQLDQRSGYPAGILDPVWQQTMLDAESADDACRLISNLAVDLCRRLRDRGHVAGTPDATEVVRLARDLCRLRRLPAPGRSELLEAVQTALVHGDLYGRGRAVAAASQRVFVGSRRGRLPEGTPRSGLFVEVEQTLRRLKLPTEEDQGNEPRDLRLDPLRSRLDRARAVVFRRLNLLGVRYAKRFDSLGVGQRENLSESWRVKWESGTTPMIESAPGVTLEQACSEIVRRTQHSDARGAHGVDEDGDSHPATIVRRLRLAAECGLTEFVSPLLEDLHDRFVHAASPSESLDAAQLVMRIQSGHVLALPTDAEDAVPPDIEAFACEPRLLDAFPFVAAALNGIDGLRGSDSSEDVVAVVDLTAMIVGDDNDDETSELEKAPESQASEDASDSRAYRESIRNLLPSLESRLKRMQADGSPRMQGAGLGALAMTGVVSIGDMGETLSGWYEAASHREGRRQLKSRLQGLAIPLLPLVLAEPDWLAGLEERMAASTDEWFLERLPALRGGFQALPESDRARLLRDRIERLEPTGPISSAARIDDPASVAIATQADRAARAAVTRLLPGLELQAVGKNDAYAPVKPIAEPVGEMKLVDRWRLVLGIKGCKSNRARQAASSLDQLYGGSGDANAADQRDLVPRPKDRGGTEKANPSPREWINDLEGLFGKDVCEDIVAEAVADGRQAVLEHLDPNKVTPSVELLEQVLSLRGGLAESQMVMLRRLARRITEKLATQLASRLRSALTGLSTPRPTLRRSRKLDFAETLKRNLNTAYRSSDGRIKIAPKRMVYRSPAKRQMDWHIIFVVDVSGSMEPSVIYSALMAAIFAELPAIDVKFFAFSTEVIEFSDSVSDPLSLLMEVQVGGGTHIGLGLRAAREAIRNPSRTIVVVVSDFEEGVSIGEMLAEVRMIVDSGAKLLGLAALDDAATPRYHAANAKAVASAGMTVAAVSPERLAQWVGDQIRGGRS